MPARGKLIRTLSDTLLAAQKSGRISPLWKVVLTHGATEYTYTQTRILKIEHTEEAFSHKATIHLDNSDGVLTAKDLKGFKAVLSYGITTPAGDEYSACAPLRVLAQRLDSVEGKLACVLEAVGIPNLLAEDRAGVKYMPLATDTKTVKTIIQDMFNGTMACFNHCLTYTLVFDSEDSLINTYVPKDTFRIYTNGSRLAALRRLLDWTKCVCLFKADGAIHIKVPTTSGVVYDYTYSLEDE